MSEPALLTVEKLEVVYHRAITAVQGISLSVRKGQIVAILGTNGAGKSTTLRAISGFLGIDDARVTDGSVTFNGKRIENRQPNEITRLGIALVPEREKVFPNLTVVENLTAPFSPRAAQSSRQRKSRLPVLSSPWRSCAPGPRGCCLAASGKCWRSPARWSADRNSCWSTNCRSALRPSWSRI